MIKTVVIDGKEVKFKASASFPLIFKSNFNSDILTIILPLLSEILEGLDEYLEDGSINEIELTPALGASVLDKMYSLELADIMHLIWTLAKCADDSIDEPIKWFNSFDEFPIFDVCVEVFPMLFSSLISKKKLVDMKKIVKIQDEQSTSKQ